MGLIPALLSSLIKAPKTTSASALQSGSFDLFFQPGSIARNLSSELHRTSAPNHLQTGFDDHLFDAQRSSNWVPIPDSENPHPISNLIEERRTRRIFDITDEEDARTQHLTLQADDTLLLMSDGVYGELSHDDLAHYLNHNPDPEDCTQAITRGVLSSIAMDNIGLIVIRANASRANLTLPDPPSLTKRSDTHDTISSDT